MNTQFKVGQRVKVITGANVTPYLLDGKTGVIADIDYAPSIEFIGLHVKFDNGLEAWCHRQKDAGIELNVEILEDTPPTPKWLLIDKDNLPDEPVLAGNIDKKQIVINRITINHLDGTIQSHNRREFFEVTHYISLTDLVNLPIAE